MFYILWVDKTSEIEPVQIKAEFNTLCFPD